MTSEKTKKVKQILHNPDKEFVMDILSKINLSVREKIIIESTELDRITISEMADKMYLSPDSVSTIKKSAMNKIYTYFLQKNYIKNAK